MDDYKINFQEIVDAFSIKELASFSIKVNLELDKRISDRKEKLEKESNELDKIETSYNACK